MATQENTTVKVYKGVPLIKGGTEVLFEAQAAGETALTQFLVSTYTKYYYARENRRAIQIGDTIENLEGCNYISYINNDHEKRIIFAFIDQLVYINDNVTQVEFTIDPFPTYLDETEEGDLVYIKRNTPHYPTQQSNFAPDYLPRSVKTRYSRVTTRVFSCTNGIAYFVAPSLLGAELTDINGNPTGVQIGWLTQGMVQTILQNNGAILGAYMIPMEMLNQHKMVENLGSITCSPFSAAGITDILNAGWQKIRTSVYNKLSIYTSQGSKNFILEDFDDWIASGATIEFGIAGLMIPSPSIYIYPKRYQNLTNNLAEGIMIQCPALPIATNATYTNLQRFNDIYGMISGMSSGIVSGAMTSGGVGALAGGAFGLISGAVGMAKNQITTEMQTPNFVSNGTATCAENGNIDVSVEMFSPDTTTVRHILNYFEYYGIAVDGEESRLLVNTDDGAYLQTGGEWLRGSVADEEINARLMSGIKIRRTFT